MASSLVKKIRIQPGQRLLILDAPPGYVTSLGELPDGVEVHEEPEGTFDFVHLFMKDSGECAGLGKVTLAAVTYDGLLRVSYPKRSSKVETDLTRDVRWKLVEQSGVRPVAQVSIDEVWSALRFRPIEAVRAKS